MHALSVVVAIRPAIDCLRPHPEMLGYIGEANTLEHQFCALRAPCTEFKRLYELNQNVSTISSENVVRADELWTEICGRALLLQKTVQAVLELLRARRLTETMTQRQAPDATSKKLVGRKKIYDAEADRNIKSNWDSARSMGSSKDEFARSQGLTRKELDRVLARIRTSENRRKKKANK